MREFSSPRGLWFIAASYLAALVLTVWPLPDWAEMFRPLWVPMVTIYWCLWLPERVGVITAFMAGLLVDALSGTLLGEHALALVLVAWAALWLHLQVRVYPWWQQCVVVAAILVLNGLALFWVDGMLGYTQGAGLRWMPVLVSAVFWPWILQVMARLHQRYQVG
ncbi:MAG TPA: rod shape-determining protein MreD [Gammaproteobacteria bacterium]|jgi:rod shape-determining protein MreD|nr:rod shape-determining protein MreD [Gammaproteobacteria bacterium]